MSRDPEEREVPEILDQEVDLDREDVRDSRGRRLDTDYVERAVADVRSRRGRPSLSEGATGEPSPHVSFRVPEQTRRRLDEVARAEGRPASEIAREALDRYLSGHA
ncbi:ribbon-helix-helix protein, CopG family [Pseudonocardia sp. MH-G8]|uniref:ribbon-helix-helix protein, CopG family n=1 Tax=Pseudonocardia sp. MH-G8 TaxID=1854588 RepID=UPI0013042AE7|nr:ribbon-helix-helix protein, CopG family [Pseudonocardia sp. MH-G8]